MPFSIFCSGSCPGAGLLYLAAFLILPSQHPLDTAQSLFITDDAVYEGQYSVQIKSTEFDNTGLVRPFDLVNGADIETWFKVDTYPIGNMGAGGCVFLMDNGLSQSYDCIFE